MTRCLIGHTGFVGGNLLRQAAFDVCFNSADFRQMAGRSFDTVVCCGVSAVKWQANRDPEADRARIAALASVLERVEARRFVLVSTVDVYPVPAGRDEADDPRGGNHAYGANRLAFEDFVRGAFPDALVVRLPGLYGRGLKKNALYDLLHDNCLGAVNPAGSFQWYDVGRLWADVQAAAAAGLRLVNLVTEPVTMREVADRCFPGKEMGGSGPAPAYDLRTRHAELFGGSGGYVAGRGAVLDGIGAWVRDEEEGARC